ncbi:MAG: transposase [Bacteroidetes bacterium]|nr:transposase [Bacteroidota bacterium]
MKQKYQFVRRKFSESFKRDIVRDLDYGVCTRQQIVQEYKVSVRSVYNWMEKYSIHYKRESNTVIQMKSEASQKKELEKRIAELERALGNKQLRVEYLEKLMELMGEEHQIDFEKKGESLHWNGSEFSEKEDDTQ